ncbi:MAG: phosphoenolpyruvate synthase/pyruvate phosphate dikinase [Candidatus Azotimanducaceae bacterium]|jgi:phosphoenolpyruvate synthase/pyruvate phosphate dikinase
MTADLVFLQEVGKQDTDLAGGKGANLGELLQQGFPVPQGFVITAQVYEKFMAELYPTSLKSNTSHRDSEEIRKAILNTNLSDLLLADIKAHDEALQQNQNETITYAVRSSATAEDLGDASFAGQHETYYYVSSEQLPLMIKKCWASLWADAAYSYRESQGIEHATVNMAVIVQELIQSDVSGITFTKDPLSGDDDHIVSDSSWGMGAAIVDGRVSPDHYVFSKKKNKLLSKRITDKKFMVPSSTESGESRLVAVPFSLRNKETLSNEQIDTITKWALKSEEYFCSPQDLEWAFHNGNFYLLQSRPITAAGEKKDEIPSGSYVLFKPLIENFTDPLLPLTQNILIKLFPMMKIIQGRVYLNIKHIRPLLPFKMTEAELAEIAYLSNKDYIQPKLSWPRAILLLILVYFNHLTVGVLYQRTDNMPVNFMSSFRKKFKRVVEDDNIDAPSTLEHLFLKARFFEPVGDMPLMANLSAPRYIVMMPILSRLLNWWIPNIRDDAAAFLTAGSEDVFSTDMGRQIWHLALIAKESKHIKDIINNHESSKALDMLKNHPSSAGFMKAFASFLAVHGHRTLKEFELNSYRWEEDPAPIIAMIRNYLRSDIDPLHAEQSTQEARLLFLKEIKQKLNNHFLEKQIGFRWYITDFFIKKTKYLIRLRENSRFFHIMGFYAIRLKILKLERLLLAQNALKCRDDIYYLEWDELTKLRDGILVWEDVEEIIRERRMDYIRLSKIKPSKTFGITLPETAAVIANQIIGQGASPGQYEGTARVITDPTTDADLHPGEILIAPYTDPAWTPLFLTASAAVVEVGSFLSHAGTIAREYGMPCVVDAADCTTRIKTGDKIRVNGSTGEVSLLEEEISRA